MRILTAIDLVKLPARPLDAWSQELNCPWCGEDAWAISDFFQCGNPACTTQAAHPMDLVAKEVGGHMQAAHYVAKELGRSPDEAGARRRARDRMIMDLWVGFCTTPPTSEALTIINRIQSKGFGIRQSRFSAAVLDSRQMTTLVKAAEATGATFPESWLDNPPPASRCFCVQSRPHTIDRIAVMSSRGGISEIVWHRKAAGIVSLIGLTPRAPRLVASDIEVSMWLQHELAAAGHYEEVACFHRDIYRGAECPRWDIKAHLLTAVTRHCKPQRKEEFFYPSDVSDLQQAIDQFPGLEGHLKGLPVDHVTGVRPRYQAVPWANLRYGMIVGMVGPRDAQMSPAAAAVFEKTGTRQADATRLIAKFEGENRPELVDDIERLSLNRVISRDHRLTVQETASDYRAIRGADTSLLTNFSLRIASSVMFRHENAARYCQATLRCGTAVTEVLFPQNLLHDRVQGLEDELQRQMTTRAEATRAGRMPTVIHVGDFRKHIIPHLKAQASSALPVVGVDLLGWSSDRKSFTTPGMVITADGRERTSEILCPSVPVLKLYGAVPSWAGSLPDDLDQSCHDLIAMLLASCVRYFRRCATQPIMVQQSSSALTMMDRLSGGMGQHAVHELNQNVRDGNRIDGVHGYPLLAAGVRSAAPQGSQVPYIHLTDHGYRMPTDPSPQQAAAAARALQFALGKVVEWCLATGGDEFQEVHALEYHRALMREGQWLLEHVCGQDDWDISEPDPTPLEELMGQIPAGETGQRITLVDGTDLTIDIRDLRHDHDGILREARDMGTMVAIEDDRLMSSAVKLLPALATYYGHEPDVAYVES